jgi:hypothetical protein
MIDIKLKTLIKIFLSSIVNLCKYAYTLFKTILVYVIGLLPLIGCGLLIIFSTHYILATLLVILEIPWLIVFMNTFNKMDDRI